MRVALVVVALSGCLQAELVECESVICPAGTVCTAGGCATPEDVAACEGKADGDACVSANGAPGKCGDGACRTGLCGNHAIDAGEVCDDGNQVSGDGCTADCGKAEICDGILDENEPCDDGNANPADGCDACRVSAWQPSALVGEPTPATSIGFQYPFGVAIDGKNRVYVADSEGNRVWRRDPDGSVSVVAGTGDAGYSGDFGPATSATLAYPTGVAVDGIGRVFISEVTNGCVRMVDLDGTIVTIATQNDGLAYPSDVAVDGLGHVYVTDQSVGAVFQIDHDGTVAQIVSGLSEPTSIAVDPNSDALVVSERALARIVSLSTSGLAVLAGTGTNGDGADGLLATNTAIRDPRGLAFDAMGRLVFADAGNDRVRRIEIDRKTTTIAGTGMFGYTGDGVAATTTNLSYPIGVAYDANGALFIVDSEAQRLRRVEAGTIATVAGNGLVGNPGDGYLAVSARLESTYSVIVDHQGRVVFSDASDYRIRRVELDGTISTIAGNGTPGFSATQVDTPSQLAVDGMGRIVFADRANHRVRRIELDSSLTVIAGNGVQAANCADGTAAIDCPIVGPFGVACDAQGRVYYTDANRIRRIEDDGTTTTVAGRLGAGSSGDNGPATTAFLGAPHAIAFDPMGRLLIADTFNHKVRRVVLGGNITLLAGDGTAGSGGDGADATLAQLNFPNGVSVDASGLVVIADSTNARVRRIEANGTISTIVGSLGFGSTGDGGPASMARLQGVNGIWQDGANTYLASGPRIRKIDATGTITTIAGRVSLENMGPRAIARLGDPRAIVEVAGERFFAGGATGTLQELRNGVVDVVAGRYPHSVATSDLARFRSAIAGTIDGVAFDTSNDKIYVAIGTEHRLAAITRVTPTDPTTWTIADLAGDGSPGFADGAAAIARFRSPSGLLLVGTTLYIADTGNHAIRTLDLSTNTVTTIANQRHSLGFADGPALDAQFYEPTAIARCDDGDLFIADRANNRIRRLRAGTITTVLGDGVPASSGEGAPARVFSVDTPRGVACDSFGNVYATSSHTVRMLVASDAHEVDGTNAVRTIYGAPPRDTFPMSVTDCLTGIASTGPTTLEVTDACSGLLIGLTR